MTISIDNPPVNALDLQTMREIRGQLAAVRHDPSVQVIVFESANPDFFVAHVDMRLGDDSGLIAEFARSLSRGLNPFQAFSESVRRAPQVTIVKLQGLARGGGAELVAAADMAFAAQESAGLAQCEVLMGITPGGGATQYLRSRMTRGRAIEAILGAELFDAATAERYGWVNRAVLDDELDAFVETLAQNISALPDGVVRAAKNTLPPERSVRGFWRETAAWFRLVQKPAAKQLMEAGLAVGAQTPAGERDLEGLLRPLLATDFTRQRS
jgi:enoyl-CoA hydratase/carnithine racemase